jgi:formyltetrahydrofolate-dependent phosphoribosylglycinamide formyltransferase
MSTKAPPNLAVMLSGSGRTLVNLAQAITEKRLHARIALVIASRVCAGCDRARELGIEPIVEPGTIAADRLERLLDQHAIDLCVLAGYLKVVRVPERYRNKIVNIHPALLPAFGGHGMYGHHVHEAVIARGCKVSGCTVHLCDDRYDTGPIIAQRCVSVLENDTPDTLAARVFEAECEIYPQAIAKLLQGRVHVQGPRAVVS